eukprot:TRINITY_DN40178_c0_g1_i1.p1 TRINITY_DN40178_c0_g1~~TRINITY_DN40178_c0_g1_i1.p1  ORF type:complete len:417 (+),score=78.28 TRINITY_DN40178_c0_g1_i1:44-1294(+)
MRRRFVFFRGMPRYARRWRVISFASTFFSLVAHTARDESLPAEKSTHAASEHTAVSVLEPKRAFCDSPAWVVCQRNLLLDTRVAGLRAFGYDELEKLLRKTVTMKVRLRGVEMNLAMHQDDKTAEYFAALDGDEDVYGYSRLADYEPGLVVDVGSHIGMDAIAAHKWGPNHTIVALEPEPIPHFYMHWNLHQNNVPVLDREGKIDTFEFAPTGGVYPRKAGLTKDGRLLALESSQVVKRHHATGWPPEWIEGIPDPPEFEVSAPLDRLRDPALTTPSMTLDHVMQAHGHDAVKFMRLDCEGCEYEVVPSWKKADMLKRIDVLAGELHDPSHADTKVDDALLRSVRDILFEQPAACMPESEVVIPGVTTEATRFKGRQAVGVAMENYVDSGEANPFKCKFVQAKGVGWDKLAKKAAN